MTASKHRKRLIRQRAQRTGESYSSALRHLDAKRDKEHAMGDLAWRRIEKPEYGYAVRVPEDWEERRPDPQDNPSVTAAFVNPADRRRHVRLLRWSVNPSTSAADIAEEARADLEDDGCGEFEQSEMVIAGRPGVQLDSVLRDAGRAWAIRRHFVVEGDLAFCLSIGTSIPEEDADLLRAIGQGFELLPTRLSESSGEATTMRGTVPPSDETLSTARPSARPVPSAPSRPREQEGQAVSAGGWRRIEKPEYDYAVRVPENWEEFPPDLKNSPWETARFAPADDRRHHFGVFRRPGSRGASAAQHAEGTRSQLERGGVAEFEQHEIVLAGRHAVRLDFVQRDAGPTWAVSEYFVVENDICFCLAFGTSIPTEVAALRTAIADGFELLASNRAGHER